MKIGLNIISPAPTSVSKLNMSEECLIVFEWRKRNVSAMNVMTSATQAEAAVMIPARTARLTGTNGSV